MCMDRKVYILQNMTQRQANSVKDVLNTPSDQQNCFKNHHSFAIALYCICYLIISPCGYWNSNTLHAIIQNGSRLNN